LQFGVRKFIGAQKARRDFSGRVLKVEKVGMASLGRPLS